MNDMAAFDRIKLLCLKEILTLHSEKVSSRAHSLHFYIQIKRFKRFKRFEFCMSQQIYSQSKKISL